jgi:PIN domain nuclease of toxin-antitoxin system
VKLLLDTVAFLWILAGAQELSPSARIALEDTENGVYLSAASVWEIAVKHRLGKLPLPQPPEILIPAQRALRGIQPIDITEPAVLRLRQLPDLHKDPFDRILACQAIEHEMTIVTPDAALQAYPIRTLW